jgi:adenylylsulfate kinase-like enzyme
VDQTRAEGVLLTGVYGSGKSTVGVEIANLLEQEDAPFALLDLDYLSWGYPGASGRHAEFKMMLQNLTAVVANYRRAGVQFFVLAYFVANAAEIDQVQAALGLPLRVVRLAVPMAVIEQRLAHDVTSGRSDDLQVSAAVIAEADSGTFDDLVVSNDRPVRAVAEQVLEFLGWMTS